MRRGFVALVGAGALALFAPNAFADPGDGTPDPPPENAPCDADHGHPPCPPGDDGGGGDGNNGTPEPPPDDPPCDADNGNPPCPPPGGGNGGNPPPPPPTGGGNCAPPEDPGILTDATLGQTLHDGGLDVSPLFEDPEANGPLSGAVYEGGNDTPLEPVTDEVACAVDLLIDETAGGDL